MLFLGIGMLTKAQSVSYSKVDENPNQYNMSVNLRLMDVDYTSKQSLCLGYGIQASLAVKKLFTIELMYNKSYSKGTDWNYHFATSTAYSFSTINTPQTIWMV